MKDRSVPEDAPTASREELSRKARYRWHPQVACRTLDGAAFVLLNSRMLSLNPVGTRIWALLERGAVVRDVAATIAQEYAVSADQAAADTWRFITALDERGMVVREDDDAD